MSIKDDIINSIIETEGGYVNDPNDSGGETKYGITVKVALENGYKGRMIDLPYNFAFKVYEKKYWNAIRGDDLCAFSDALAFEVADTAVNMGVSRAGKFLQRALNVFTESKLTVDGIIGPATIRAIKDYMIRRKEATTLVKALNCLQGARYIELAESRKKDRNFVYGWIKNRVEL